ncbi:MAG: prepilin-type N-terminal cleavage/methylation domain-containing protein [Planctomycetaceae bacterium]
MKKGLGFTLLELLIALALSVLLMSGIYGAISMYLSVTQSDESDIDRSRVARAILRDLSIDLQSVVFRVEEPVEEGADDGSIAATGTASEQALAEDEAAANEAASGGTIGGTITVSPEEAYTSQSIGLTGDETKLVLHVSRPLRGAAYTAVPFAYDVRTRTSDLISVSYFLADPNEIGLAGAVGQLSSRLQTSNIASQGIQGLARLVGDRMAIDYADSESDVDTLAAASQVIAPEVIGLRFQYFDGIDWQETWDSTEMGRLPNAVSIELGMRRSVSLPDDLPEEKLTPGERASFTTIVEWYRQVVALPLAKPFTEAL